MSPVAWSTSTSTAVQLNSKNAAVPPSGWSGSASLRISPMPDELAAEPAEARGSARRGSAGRARRSGPRRGRRRSPSSSTASSRAAIARSFAWTSRQALRTALPISTDERLAEVCWSYGTTAVSPMTTVTQSSGAPSSCGGDLGEDRPGALAHVGRAGVDDDAAVGEQADRRVGQAGRRPGLEPDRDARDRDRAPAGSPTRSARPLARRSGPSPRRPACRPG